MLGWYGLKELIDDSSRLIIERKGDLTLASNAVAMYATSDAIGMGGDGQLLCSGHGARLKQSAHDFWEGSWAGEKQAKALEFTPYMCIPQTDDDEREMPLASILCDKDGRRVYVNRKYIELLGYEGYAYKYNQLPDQQILVKDGSKRVAIIMPLDAEIMLPMTDLPPEPPKEDPHA